MTEGTTTAAPRSLALLLAALATVSPFSIDTFFPSLQALAGEFGVGLLAIQQTLTAYMLPYALMSLVQGPLSDSLGRRPVIIAGLTFYTLASVGCALAPGFGSLLVFRALQGATAGVGMIVGRAVLRDLYAGPAAQRLLSLITMLFGLAPALAPVIGGYLHVYFGWRAVFVFLAFFGAALVLATARLLPETHPRELRPALEFNRLARTALHVASHREFLVLGLAGSVSYATMMCFIGAAPMLVLHHWHLKETQFAWLFLPLIAGLMSGAALSGQMAGRLAPRRQSAIGFAVALAAAGSMTLLQALVPGLPIWIQQGLLFAIALGVQLTAPPITLRMLDIFPRARGSAASVQSCLSILSSAVVFGAVAPLAARTLVGLSGVATAASLVAALLWMSAPRLAALR